MRKDKDLGHWITAPGPAGQAVPAMVLTKWRWYAKGSTRHSRRYALSEVTAIVTAAAIPVAAACNVASPIVAGLGAVVLVATSMRTVFGAHENWIEFSQVRYGIEREAALFLVGAPPYNAEDAAQLLVVKVEDLTFRSGGRWAQQRLRLSRSSIGAGANGELDRTELPARTVEGRE